MRYTLYRHCTGILFPYSLLTTSEFYKRPVSESCPACSASRHRDFRPYIEVFTGRGYIVDDVRGVYG